MKKFKILTTTILICFGFCQLAWSQITTAPGYIVKTSGDTVFGALEYVNTNISAKRLFIPVGESKITKLTPEAVQGFKINDEVNFRALPFKGKKVFMQVVSTGQLNLFSYKGDLFIKTKSDSLILLTGGKKTVEQNGKKYGFYDYTYKSQLRKALQGNAYNPQIERLRFDKKQIIKLAQEINEDQTKLLSKAQLQKQHHFEIRAGFTFSKAVLTYIPYQQDSLQKSETHLEYVDIEYLPDEKQKLGNITAGFLYKKKIGRKYSYLKTGILYNKALKLQRAHSPVMHTRFKSLGNGYAKLDTVGWSFDYYTYNLSNLEVPMSYYSELTDGKFRPFLELGLTTKILSNAIVTLKREIYDETHLLRTETGRMKLPDFTVAPMLGFGGRYLLNQKSSLIIGAHLDYYLSSQLSQKNNFRKAANMNFYVGYGF